MATGRPVGFLTRELSGEPEPVSDGALQQRDGARRAAVVAMKADLLKLVAAESALTTDSGHSRLLMPGHTEPWCFGEKEWRGFP